MIRFECLVVRDRVKEKTIRYYDDLESALAWLELEGYQVLNIRPLSVISIIQCRQNDL